MDKKRIEFLSQHWIQSTVHYTYTVYTLFPHLTLTTRIELKKVLYLGLFKATGHLLLSYLILLSYYSPYLNIHFDLLTNCLYINVFFQS